MYSLHCARFCAISGFKFNSFMSFLTHSSHVFLGLPLQPFPSTLTFRQALTLPYAPRVQTNAIYLSSPPPPHTQYPNASASTHSSSSQTTSPHTSFLPSTSHCALVSYHPLLSRAKFHFHIPKHSVHRPCKFFFVISEKYPFLLELA